MGSYGDESYTPRYTPSSRPIFKPEPKPEPEPTSTKKTGRAANVKPPVTVIVARPKGAINLVMAFDVTGSMSGYRENIREKASYLYGEIAALLPELVGDMEFSFVGIGDHCDGPSLMIQPTAFSDDVGALKTHIESIENSSGGDVPEAIECFFKTLNSWDIEGTNTIVVLVTDSIPHGMGFDGDDGCSHNVDWEKELKELKKRAKAFYLVSCSGNTKIKRFQKRMVDDEEHIVELGADARRLTNIVHGIIAKEVGEIDTYLDHLAKTRGTARVQEVKTLLKTKS